MGGVELEKYAFARRGDFAEFNYSNDFENDFYEWCLVLEKSGKKSETSFPNFSFERSKVYDYFEKG